MYTEPYDPHELFEDEEPINPTDFANSPCGICGVPRKDCTC